MTSVVVRSAEEFYLFKQDSFSVGLFLGAAFVSLKRTQEQPIFKPAKYALSKSLHFCITQIHYQYCKGYNLSISWR